MSRLARLAILLVLTAYAAGAEADAVQEAEGVARAFYTAYTDGRTADIAPLWNADALAAVRPALERTAQTRCMTLDDLEVSGSASGDTVKVTARVTVTIWSAYPPDRPRSRVLNETLVLRREGTAWNIVSRGSVEEALAERLAASDEAAAEAPAWSEAWSAPELVQALCRRVVLLINQQQPDRATLLLERARALVDEQDFAGASAVAGVGSILIRHRGRPPAEIRLLVDESLRFAERSGDPDTLARALLRSGRAAQFATGETPEEPFARILALSDVVQDASVLAHAATQLAMLTSDEGDYRASLQYSVLALEHARRSGDATAQLSAQLNLAGAYSAQNDLQPAALHYEEAARLAEQTGNNIAAASVLGFLAMLRQRSGEDVSALFTRALQLVPDTPAGVDVLMELLPSRARVHIYRGELTVAEADLVAALGVAPCSLASNVNDVLLIMAEVRRHQGRYAEALALVSSVGDRSLWTESLAGLILLELGRCDEARPFFEDAVA
ncbi:MAG: hypothetical protein QOH21_1844, partial [Acidobacteriota bacterium]|nr:hypothetical protein [Acidobacteriota bacterium]